MVINFDLPEQCATIFVDLYVMSSETDSEFLSYINQYIDINFASKNIDIATKMHVLTQLYSICLQLSVINNKNTKDEDIMHILDMLGTHIFVFFSPSPPETYKNYANIVDHSEYLIDILISDKLITTEQAKIVKKSINNILSKHNSTVLII